MSNTGLMTRSKKELVDIIHELQAKLKELKPVESHITAKLEELHSPAIGLIKTPEGEYQLVEILFDVEKNSAQIAKLGQKRRDPAMTSYKLKEYVIEHIFRVVKGDKKTKEKKNV